MQRLQHHEYLPVGFWWIAATCQAACWGQGAALCLIWLQIQILQGSWESLSEYHLSWGPLLPSNSAFCMRLQHGALMARDKVGEKVKAID